MPNLDDVLKEVGVSREFLEACKPRFDPPPPPGPVESVIGVAIEEWAKEMKKRNKESNEWCEKITRKSRHRRRFDPLSKRS